MSLDVNFDEPDEFCCDELHSCVQSVAAIKGIEDFNYDVDFLCGKGESYIANVFRVLIKDNGNPDKSVSVIVKTLVNTTRQELFHELHEREVIAYRDVIDQFADIQKNLEDHDKVVFPKCITSCLDKGNEVIILEDLLLKGFEIEGKAEKLVKMDFNLVCLVIKNMAKFHALSFVFQNKDLNKYEESTRNFHDLIFSDSFINKSKLRNFFVESNEMSLKGVIDLEAKTKLVAIKEKLFDILKTYTKPRKFNVFCHGDCWINNILFNYKETRTQMCFLDFQAMRYASPVTDVINFLYLCTDSQFRSDHIEDIKSVHYSSLQSFLNLFNLDANIAYPVQEFENDMNEFMSFGLLIALIELRAMSSQDSFEHHEDLSKCEDVGKSEDSNNLSDIALLKKVNDVVKEAVDNGVLDKLCDF